MSNLKYGLFVPQGWRLDLVDIDPQDQWAAMNKVAQHADQGQWESIWVYDHFHTVPDPVLEATHEAWTLMAAFAASTKRVHLGQMCTCMGYRNPTYLAKVAATVDVISGGRAYMGIGAGWYEHEWLAYGYGFPPIGERISRLDEGVQIMRQAWSEGTATLNGKYYTVDGAIVNPKPVQDGGIPLWIAGGGEKRTLKLVAKYGDYANIISKLDLFEHKRDVLYGHCKDLGRDPNTVTISTNLNVVIGRTRDEVEEKRQSIRARMAAHLPSESHSKIDADLEYGRGVGTVEEVAEYIQALKGLGLGYLITYFPEAAYDLSGVELFEKEIMPSL